MFGIPSLAKLAILAVLLFVGWNMFRWLQGLKGKSQDNKTLEAEVCEKCGVYIAGDDVVSDCKEPKCPHR